MIYRAPFGCTDVRRLRESAGMTRLELARETGFALWRIRLLDMPTGQVPTVGEWAILSAVLTRPTLQCSD